MYWKLLHPRHMSDDQERLHSFRSLVDHREHATRSRQVQPRVQIRGGSLLPQLMPDPDAGLPGAHSIGDQRGFRPVPAYEQPAPHLARLRLAMLGQRPGMVIPGETMPGLCMAEDEQSFKRHESVAGIRWSIPARPTQ